MHVNSMECAMKNTAVCMANWAMWSFCMLQLCHIDHQSPTGPPWISCFFIQTYRVVVTSLIVYYMRYEQIVAWFCNLIYWNALIYFLIYGFMVVFPGKNLLQSLCWIIISRIERQWWALTRWSVDPLLTKLTFLLTSWSVIFIYISGNFRFLWSRPFSLYFR